MVYVYIWGVWIWNRKIHQRFSNNEYDIFIQLKKTQVRAGGGLWARAAPTQGSGLPSRGRGRPPSALLFGGPGPRTRPSAEKPAEAAAKAGVKKKKRKKTQSKGMLIR